MRRIGLLACVVATSFAAAACGGSSSGGSSSPQSSTSPQPSSTPTAAFDKTAAKAAAQQALLTTADFPSGWTSSPADNSDDGQINTKLASCMHVSPSLFGQGSPDGVSVDSPDFAPPGNTGASVSETVNVGTSAKADAEFALLKSPRLTGCLDSVFGPFLKANLAKDPSTKDAKLGTPTTKHLDFTALGDETDAFDFSIPFEIQGQQATVYVDFVFIRHNNSDVQLSFSNVLSPFDLATAESFASKALDKLTAANIPAA